MPKNKINGKRRKMKNKIAPGIAIATLLLVIVAFSGCVEDEKTKSTENGILPQKTALQPGVYDVSELSSLPMTISLGNDTYLVLTDADKETISGYFENKGRYPSFFDLEVIFRDKNGKVVNDGVKKIIAKEQAIKKVIYLRKVPVYIKIPLDFFETWEVRGNPTITLFQNILDIGRAQEVKLSMYEFGSNEYLGELAGTIDVKRSGKDTVTATLVGEIESKSDKTLRAELGFGDSNWGVYEDRGMGQQKSTAAYLYLEPFEKQTFEVHFSTPAYETDELFLLILGAFEDR